MTICTLRISATTLLILAAAPVAAVTGYNLDLELQSDCMSSDDMFQVLGNQLLPGLQALRAPVSSLGRESLSSDPSTDSVSFEGFSITSGDDRRYLDEIDYYNNTNTTMDDGLVEDLPTNAPTNSPSSLRGGGAITGTPTSEPLAVLNCPLFKRCPCSGCPGHCCLVFSGFEGGQRQRNVVHPEYEMEDKNQVRRTIQQPSGNEEAPSSPPGENIFLRDPTVANDRTHIESLYCNWLELALLDLEHTCLREATILRCRLE